ncbi:MAG: co-chaperone DjlA [Pseudomonadales bacterium]|nr:co-chaperone DjlA [Pseudomonadales bacterium]
MSWWGKVIGGTFGFMLGGPLGAVMGAALGHNFDRGLNMGGPRRIGGGANVEKIQSVFFTATFSMMGYLAKADGQVSADEISAARHIMRQMRLSPEQEKVAIKLFNQGKQPGFPAEDILQQFRLECHRRRNLIQMFLEILVVTAFADGDLHQTEDGILRNAALTLGFSSTEFNNLLSRIRAQAHFQKTRQQSKNDAMSVADAYQLLGLKQNASAEEVKKAYRRQMNQHHPDKLVSKGLPQEMMEIANQKSQDIRSAYELIRNAQKT